MSPTISATLYRSNAAAFVSGALDSGSMIAEGHLGDLVQRAIEDGSKDGIWRYIIATDQDPPRLFKSSQIIDLVTELGIEQS